MSFATRAAAARSTAQFKKEVAVLGGVAGRGWGWSVTGRKKEEVEKESKNEAPVTLVMGVRKKRKDGDAAAAVGAGGGGHCEGAVEGELRWPNRGFGTGSCGHR